MTDAPERIWATEDAANLGEDKFHTTRPMPGLTEYIRADLMTELVDALSLVLAWHDKDKYASGKMTFERSGAFGKARAALAKIKEQQA